MVIRLNFKSGVPVYLQIVAQVKAAAGSGSLRDGEPLPSVRILAEELRINRNTVAKAYAELESEGVIETRPGAGCFLRTNGTSPLRRSVRTERLGAELDGLIVQAHHLQISDAELRQLLDERLHAFHQTQHENARSREKSGEIASHSS
ncbi:MAG TPA: GntR family transcriptional regulator [Candidatus Limnocylindria bacterium]|jgi:GntR family transcriptional regulator|nr:GntR family transcriptional regulator [Candidatus Limnocylindria bacterium]